MSVIVRSHGLDPAQLFAWRRRALASGLVAPVSGAPPSGQVRAV
nr:transposase [Bradyrhizobium diversitatis]